MLGVDNVINKIPQQDSQKKKKKKQHIRTAIVCPSNQGNIDNAEKSRQIKIQKSEICIRARNPSGVVTCLPLHRRGLQRPREVLQVLRAPLAAPRLERRARCMMVPHWTLDTDVRLFMVALQHGYVHRALSCFVSLLCRQTAQVRVQPTGFFIFYFIFFHKGDAKLGSVGTDSHQSNRGRSLIASSIVTKLKGAVPASACTARAMSPFGKRTSSLCVWGKSCVGGGAASRGYPRRAPKRKNRTRVCGVP